MRAYISLFMSEKASMCSSLNEGRYARQKFDQKDSLAFSLLTVKMVACHGSVPGTWLPLICQTMTKFCHWLLVATVDVTRQGYSLGLVDPRSLFTGSDWLKVLLT